MTVNQRPRRRPYRTGDDNLDAKIAELVESSAALDSDLMSELLTASVRLSRNRADRGEMKLVNAAVKELVYAFKVFRKYRGVRKVSIFGSSRATPHDSDYGLAEQLGATMAQRGWMVITGAGPGIMEAGNKGAGADRSFGANIRLPLEAEPNVVIEGDPKLINFRYFFTRKVTFLKESHAFVLFPGGYGTMDETFELLTLMQTGRSDLHPIVLIEAPGGSYWHDWRRFVDRCLAGRKMIGEADTDLFHIAKDIDDAVSEIEGFYRNYQSERYVGGTLVLRVLRAPPQDELDHLARQFSDILHAPTIDVVEPSPQEVAENDALELQRIAIPFNQRSFGRLRQLVDAINRF